jgi:hypothetical protein
MEWNGSISLECNGSVPFHSHVRLEKKRWNEVLLGLTSMVALENAGASFLVLKVNGHRFINI